MPHRNTVTPRINLKAALWADFIAGDAFMMLEIARCLFSWEPALGRPSTNNCVPGIGRARFDSGHNFR
jgi:hypothetical protein